MIITNNSYLKIAITKILDGLAIERNNILFIDVMNDIDETQFFKLRDVSDVSCCFIFFANKKNLNYVSSTFPFRVRYIDLQSPLKTISGELLEGITGKYEYIKNRRCTNVNRCLTSRQFQYISMRLNGLDYKKIAREMRLSIKTISYLKMEIERRTGVRQDMSGLKIIKGIFKAENLINELL